MLEQIKLSIKTKKDFEQFIVNNETVLKIKAGDQDVFIHVEKFDVNSEPQNCFEEYSSKLFKIHPSFNAVKVSKDGITITNREQMI